jgi:hypothetical protein
MASFLDGMFTYMRLHDWPEAPVRPLIFPEDKIGRGFRRPRPITRECAGTTGRSLAFTASLRAQPR